MIVQRPANLSDKNTEKFDENAVTFKTVTNLECRQTSNLAAPIMRLSGHSGEVFTMKFSPDGLSCASGSFDRNIFLWRVFSVDCDNYMMVQGHKNAVVELHWTNDGERLISCSPDRTVRAWDVHTGEQVKKMEHEALINSCCPTRNGTSLVVSGSDDGCMKVWDLRVKRSVGRMVHKYPVTAVAFAESDENIYSGSLDGNIRVWDIRNAKSTSILSGHSDTVTALSLSPDGYQLLSNSFDNTLRIWDVRPYAPKNRCIKVLTGHIHTFEKNLLKCGWSPAATRVSAGSGDRMVYIWDVDTRRVLYRLPGHMGSVNEVVFHPDAPVIGSCSADKDIYLGEVAQ